MGRLAFIAMAVVLLGLVTVVVIAWDRLVGMALVGVAAGPTWVVAHSEGPMVVLASSSSRAVLGVIAAFLIAVLVS